MFFWVREVAGWALIAVSLVVLKLGINFAVNPEKTQIVEASVVLFAALGVMRSGVLLVRMSTAARISRSETKENSA